MRQPLAPLLALSLPLAFWPGAASATSTDWVRSPTAASAGRCEGGQLVERVVEGGSVMSSYATHALACMRSTTRADWVLLSSASCGDRVNGRPDQCGTGTGRPGMNQVRAIAAYAEGNGAAIRLPRATFGETCLNVSGRDGGYGHWECASYKRADGIEARVSGGRFREMGGEVAVTVLGRPVEVPMDFPKGFDDHALFTGVKGSDEVGLAWRGGAGGIAYSQPETDSLARLTCSAPGEVELVASDPFAVPPKFRDGTGNVFALDRTERVGYRTRMGDGDEFVIRMPADGLALDGLVRDQPLRVQFPNGEWLSVPGAGAGKPAARLRAACLAKPKPRPVAEGDAKDGWWVVLALGPNGPDPATNGAGGVAKGSRNCGVRTFDDVSDRYEGFERGWKVFILLGSPYGNREMAEANLRLVENCFPGAHVKRARLRADASPRVAATP